jgi:prepilin-type N-terminal cleavage/methylation domain-containing protein
MKLKSKKQNSGFTLIEVLVSIFIFGLVLTIGITAVLNAVAANRKSRTITSVMSNLQVALEDMSRTIRDGSGFTVSGANNEIFTFTPGGVPNPREYFLRTTGANIDHIMLNDNDGAGDFPVTGDDVKILSLTFKKSLDTIPKISIFIHGQVGTRADSTSDFYIQNLVSPR